MQPPPIDRVRRFGIFELETATCELTRAGRRVHLPPQAAKLLVLLTGRAGELVTREEIRTLLWGNDTFVDFESAMNACVSQIRAALGDRASTPRFVETLPRRGYRFLAPVTSSVPPAFVADQPDQPPESLRTLPLSRRWAVTAVLLLIAAMTLAWVAARRQPLLEGVRLAVLPIDTPIGDEPLASLATLLQERTLIDLFDIAGGQATVVAKSAVDRLRGDARTPDALRELQLHYWVDASMQRLPDGQVRLHTKVARLSDFRILSAQDYVLPYDTIIERRTEVGSELAHRLVSAATRGAPEAAADIDARDVALTAEAALDRGGREEIATAVERLERAIRANPSCTWTRGLFARALARASVEQVLSRTDGLARAKREALAVLRRDIENPDAWAALGAAQMWGDDDPVSAGRSLTRAVNARGATWDARLWHAAWLRSAGHEDASRTVAAVLARERPLTVPAQNGGTMREPEPIVVGLDHVPVAVNDLEKAGERYRALGFVLKPGRPHANGIRNLHAKFAEGTEIELITAPAAVDSLTKKYRNHLSSGDGPAFLALFAPSQAKRAATLAAPVPYIFFGSRQGSPTDRPEHFVHANTAYSLTRVWLAGDTLNAERKLFTALGARLRTATVSLPDATSATVAEFQKGSIVLLPGRRQIVRGRLIVGITVTVRDLDETSRVLGARGRRSPNGESLFVAPEDALGYWLEFRQGKRPM